MGNKPFTLSTTTIEALDCPDLPLDIWRSVLFQLTDVEDVISVIRLCKTIHLFGQDDLFWKRLYEIYQPRFAYAHPKKWSVGIPFEYYGGEFKILSEESQQLVLKLQKQSWKNQFIYWYRRDLIKSLHQDDRIVINLQRQGCRHRSKEEFTVYRNKKSKTAQVPALKFHISIGRLDIQGSS